MKRTWKIVIAVCIIVLIGAGILYAVWRFAGRENQPVQVAPVSSLDYNTAYADFFGYYDDETGSSIEGSIVSRDSQHISLESDLELKEVKVKEGDTVKAGDVLLVYDMTAKELEREMKDLDVQLKRIYLNKSEKDLEKLKSQYPSLYESTMNSMTKVEDIQLSTEKTSEKESSKSASLEPETNVRTMEGDDLQLIEIEGDAGSDSAAADDSDSEEFLVEDPDEGEEGSGNDEDGGNRDPGSDILDPDEASTEEVQPDDIIEVLPDEDDGDTPDEESDRDRTRILTEFLSAVNVLAREYSASRYELEVDDVMDALKIFEENLGVADSEPVVLDPDAFGEVRRIPVYNLSRETIDLLERSDSIGYAPDEMIMLLEQGYLRALYFRLVAEMNEILPAGKKTSNLSDAEVKGLEAQIRSAADAYYSLYYYWRYLKDKYADDEPMQTFLEDYENALKTVSVGEDAEADMTDNPGLGEYGDGQLSRLIKRLSEPVDVPDTEKEQDTEKITEGFEPETFDDDDGIGDDFDDSDDDESAEEKMFNAISDCRTKQLELRTEELKLRKLDDELKQGTVVAGIDGVVRTVGDPDEGAVMDDFIVIFGGQGLYAMGTVSEFKRSSLSIGDTVKGQTEDGVAFTAKITEISAYPQDGSSDYFYYGSGSENTNASHYPFYAFIEDDTDIMEGFATLSLETDKTSSGEIGLDKMFIRQEPNGRSYVFVAGQGGKLEKRYVSVSPADYYINVTEGLSGDDLIAFPYGDNVKEGASVVETASLYGDEDDIYW